MVSKIDGMIQIKITFYGGATINRISFSKRFKFIMTAFIVMLLIIIGFISRVNSHTVYSYKETSLTMEQIQEECPQLIITDYEQLIGGELMRIPEVQEAMNDETACVVLDKSLAEEFCNKTIPDFKVSDLSVLGRYVFLDGHYANNRCILEFIGNDFVRKTISYETKIIYENDNNKEIKKHEQYLNIMKSIFG